METDINAYMKEGKEYMDNAITHLKGELLKIRAGKASPSMLNGVMVDYYGNPTPLNQVANISTPDSKSLSIQPWEKSMLAVIEQAIFASNMGLTPQNDGETVRINIPPLTEDRRKDLVKQVKKEGEEAKVSLRHARHKLMDFIKKAVKDGYPEDGGKMKEEEVEKMIKKYYEDIEELVKSKETDIMTV
jgi:ribosome recycling factor